MPLKGYKQTDEHRQRISAALRANGIHPDPEKARATQFKKGFVPWNYKGEPYHLRNGYVGAFKDGHTRLLHVLIAEEILGRPLNRAKGEMVHHINLDKADNRRCNLLICDQKYHRWLHYTMEMAWAREHLCTAGG